MDLVEEQYDVSSYRALDHRSLVRALAHPLRARILSALEQRTASPRELADELEAPLGNVSYHVRRLLDLELIRLVRETPRRGAIEHHYEATDAIRVTDQVWGGSTGIARRAMAAASIEEIGQTVTAAAAAGGFDAEGARLTRLPLALDQVGWTEVASALAELSQRVESIARGAADRAVGNAGEAVREAGVVTMLFESPQQTLTEQRASRSKPATG
jgi:DNA-binding transcriptional ArsR family regulator